MFKPVYLCLGKWYLFSAVCDNFFLKMKLFETVRNFSLGDLVQWRLRRRGQRLSHFYRCFQSFCQFTIVEESFHVVFWVSFFRKNALRKCRITYKNEHIWLKLHATFTNEIDKGLRPMDLSGITIYFEEFKKSYPRGWPDGVIKKKTILTILDFSISDGKCSEQS